MTSTKPWLAFYGDVPESIEYPRITLYEALRRSAAQQPGATAVDFLGSMLTYSELIGAVDRCSAALASLGVTAGDRITISMPTCPQGVIAFYAASKRGAVASLIHPLSTPSEIEGYLTMSRSRVALTLDVFYAGFAEVRERTGLEALILAKVSDYLPPVKRLGFWLTRGRKIPPVPADASVQWWAGLMSENHPAVSPASVSTDDLAANPLLGRDDGCP
jgi:long-chain acyl-CoA synthetase